MSSLRIKEHIHSHLFQHFVTKQNKTKQVLGVVKRRIRLARQTIRQAGEAEAEEEEKTTNNTVFLEGKSMDILRYF